MKDYDYFYKIDNEKDFADEIEKKRIGKIFLYLIALSLTTNLILCFNYLIYTTKSFLILLLFIGL